MPERVIIDVIGWIGASCVLSAYLLVSLNKVRGYSWSFQSLNIIGAVGLAINTFYFEAYPSTMVNVVWIGIAALSLSRARRLKQFESLSQ